MAAINGYSDYMMNKVLDAFLGLEFSVFPGTVYVALYSVIPNADGTGGTELSGYDYARVAVTNNGTNWPAAVAGVKSNGADIQFPAASGGDWATAVAFCILDDPTAGNILYGALLTDSGGTPKTYTCTDGQTLKFPATGLRITQS